MAHYLGDMGAATGIPVPNAAGAFLPLDPQTKASLLAQMPFVSEQFGDDMADLGDATPTGKGRRNFRIGLGVALGLAMWFAYSKAMHGKKGKR